MSDEKTLPSSPTVAGKLTLFALLTASGCAIDLLTKHYIFAWRGWPRADNRWWIFDQHFGIETSVNHGALFGLGHGYSGIFAVLSIAAFCGITAWITMRPRDMNWWLITALGLVSGGILGNLYDRLGLWHTAATPEYVRYGVRDWILFQLPEVPVAFLNPWPNFNVADMVLVVGAIMLAIQSFRAEPESDLKAETSA